MSNEQIKKDLLIQRAFLKKELDQLRLLPKLPELTKKKRLIKD